jgi:hypothetical protein
VFCADPILVRIEENGEREEWKVRRLRRKIIKRPHRRGDGKREEANEDMKSSTC